MNILQVCQRYWPCVSGSERYVQESSERLAREGHNVTVYTTDADDIELFWRRGFRRIPRGEDEHNGVSIHRFPVRHLPLHFPLTLGLSMLPIRAVDLRFHQPSPFVPDLFRAKSDGFDVVHTSSLPYNSILFAGLHLARRSGARLITTPHVHTGQSGSSRVSRTYLRPAQQWLLHQSQLIVTHTKLEADYLVGRGFSSERIRVIPCGINPRELAGGNGLRFRTRHGLPEHEAIVFYIGMSAYDKGTHHLVRAMKLLWSRGVQATLVLAGASQPHFRRFWNSQPRPVQQRTLVLGAISEADKRDLLAAGQVFAMPSHNETFGIVYLEAWAYGVPVIGANAGGIPDVITHGENGLLVEFGDIARLAASIERLLEDKNLRTRLGETGRGLVL
ncbi:MAG: glycosyltransferase family 4 protein, partial [Chloroflexi bacterium]|nr:glycosyltransferase family 4 protein [Chloroflexota bacterium]